MSETTTQNDIRTNRPVEPSLPKKQYLANCIWHIQGTDCHVNRLHDRNIDIAEAFLIAAESGIEAAHSYLINLSKQAYDGKYVE